MITKRSFLFIAVLLNSFFCFSQGQLPKVYGVFIYSFAKNLQWPASANDFIIGVMDHQPLMMELEKIATTKSLGERKIAVKSIKTIDDINSCNILFLSNTQSGKLNDILTKFHHDPILIISEQEGLARKGSGINFFFVDGKMRFEFNLKSIEDRGIKMPANLKSLGVQVDAAAN